MDGGEGCMNDTNFEAFTSFVRDRCGDLLQSLAGALGISWTILDAGDRVLLKTPTKTKLDKGTPRTKRQTRVLIESHDRIIGTLVAHSEDENIRALAISIATEIEKRFALEQEMDEVAERLAQTSDEISLLFQLGRMVKVEEGFAPNARRLLEETGELLDHRLLVLNAPGQDCLTWAVGSSYTVPGSLCSLLANQRTFRELCGNLDHAFQGDMWSDRSSREMGTAMTPFGSIAYVLIPIWIRDVWGGYVGLFRAEHEPPFETGELRIVQCLAHNLGNTATTQQLNEDLRDLLFNLARSLVAAIEAKDEYTRGHSERVYQISMRMGKRLGLAREDLENLSWASLLHDIGKLAIPDSILCSPSKLTQEEFDVIKTHPDRGCRVLELIPQMHDILPLIRHHHERIDGGGYPAGLTGEAIPFLSRIISVADTYDAIVSARPYRAPGKVELALSEIHRVAGTQLDSCLVAAFLEMIAEEGLAREDRGAPLDSRPYAREAA
jgi:HD-GYP domain-containing protein (c-di-GMP phosphodiesterase class II)